MNWHEFYREMYTRLGLQEFLPVVLAELGERKCLRCGLAVEHSAYGLIAPGKQGNREACDATQGFHVLSVPPLAAGDLKPGEGLTRPALGGEARRGLAGAADELAATLAKG